MKEDVSDYFYGVKEDVSADYKDLAFFLGIEDTRNIESRNRDDKSCCMDVLQTWKREKGDQATAEVLKQALISAKLQSAADNLRRNRSGGNEPVRTSNQHNVDMVEKPEIVENTSSENGSFSCGISNSFYIFCTNCDKTVWFGLFYTICFFLAVYFNPNSKIVIIIAVASFAVYAIREWYAITKRPRGVRYKSAQNNSEFLSITFVIWLAVFEIGTWALMIAMSILVICSIHNPYVPDFLRNRRPTANKVSPTVGPSRTNTIRHRNPCCEKAPLALNGRQGTEFTPTVQMAE